MLGQSTIILLHILIHNVLPQNHSILPNPLFDECGRSDYASALPTANHRSRLGDHPWVVGLIYWWSVERAYEMDCIGTLITKRHVLAHSDCIHRRYDELHSVRLGEWDTSSDIDCDIYRCAPATIEIPVEKVFTRSSAEWSWSNVISVIKLEREAPLSRWIYPVCLPNPKVHEHVASYVGASFTVLGWSNMPIDDEIFTSTVLLARQIVVDADELCAFFYYYRNKYDHSTNFCVNKSKAPCRGDGPILGVDTSNPDKPYWYLFGIAMAPPPDCAGYPKINELVFPALKWIRDCIEL